MNFKINKRSIKKVKDLMREIDLNYKLIIEKDEDDFYAVYFEMKTKRSHLFENGLERFYFSLYLSYPCMEYLLQAPNYKQSMKNYLLSLKAKEIQ